MSGLANRWQREWSARRLRTTEGVHPPHLLHVLQRELSAVALRLAEQWRVPYLQTVDEFMPVGSRLRISSKWCRGLVAPSRALADDLMASLGVPDHMIALVPPSLNGPVSPVCRPGNAHVPVVGVSSPLVPGSGVAVFVDAARLVCDAGVDAEFVIAGQGPGETDLRRRAERLRITERITFAGALAAGPALWQVLDVFCQTSLMPTVGRPLAHALARGVPAIASDVAGIEEWTLGREKPRIWSGSQPDEAGGFHPPEAVRLVPPGDAEALATAIQEAVRDVGRPGAPGGQVVSWTDERFRPEIEARDLAALYRRVLQGNELTDSMATAAFSSDALGLERSGIPGAES